jgi:hypothetical protein
MKMLKTMWWLKNQGHLVEHNPTRQAAITPHILYLGLLILLTGCNATLEVRPEQVPGKTSGPYPGGPYPGGPYSGGPYSGGPYLGGPYPSAVSYPGTYQNNHSSSRDPARGQSFSLKITSTG